MFFFEKKNQKTFAPLHPTRRLRRDSTNKSLLLLFFRKEDFLRCLYLSLFAALFLLPLTQMLYPLVQIDPLQENRLRAAPPALRDLARPSVFITRAQDWFNDHYGFRDLLIRAETQADYSLFGVSDRIHIGQQGWLYYRSVIDHEEPLVESMTDADLDRAIALFTRLRDFLAGRGIRLIVITNQLKDRFYPEFLPPTAQWARARHRFDDFRRRLHALPGITYIDTTDSLQQLKTRRPIFFKTDFHWNEPAAFETAAELVNDIAALSGLPTPFWHAKLAIDHRPYSGGQAMFMPLFDPPSEDGLFVHQTWTDLPLTYDFHQAPFELVTKAPPGTHRLPPTVADGDSFFDVMLRCGLESQFDELHIARGVPNLDAALRAIPADTKFFILQFIEIRLPELEAVSIPN
jgi:hypothetical protein